MRRAVITGYGIVSPIGNNVADVTESLRNGTSGIRFQEDYKEVGLRSQVAGNIEIDLDEHIDRKPKRFMGKAASYAYIAMKEAIEHAGLEESDVSNPRSGLVAGSGGASSENVVIGTDILRDRGVKRIGPYMVPRTMSSTVSACLATPFKIKGLNCSVTSACATSVHCIGLGVEQIQMGKQDIVFAGGGEEDHWSQAMMFDAMGALSTKYNDTPDKASRPYDAARDGFVIAGGGGMVVVEELEHAKARGANILAEVVGYGATSDGADMVAPSGEGAVRCMKMAMDGVEGSIDYINTHGTSTPVGDPVELQAIRETFGDELPAISSTKSLCGHSLGATGVHETIYCLTMMRNDFICASANVENLDPKCEGFPIVTQRKDGAGLRTVLTNSFGFGGTNGCLVLQKLDA